MSLIPVVIRVPREEFVRLVTGDTFGEAHRYGKFLLFPLASGRILVVNPMLTGRFSLRRTRAKKPHAPASSSALERQRASLRRPALHGPRLPDRRRKS